MHSGTHLLRHVVLKAEGKNEQDLALFNGNSDNKMFTFHLTECERHKAELKYPIFTSLRHPRRIAESFRRRAQHITKPRYPYTQEYYDIQFRELIDRIAPLDPIYLHVDHDVRDKEVQLISDAVNLPLKADWSVNKASGSVAGTHDIDLDLCPEVNSEYIDFYYSTIERMEKLYERATNR